MTDIEWFLIIGATVAPIIALLFVLPKKIKKKPKTFETTPYVAEKEEKKVEKPKEELKIERPFASVDSEIESYRDYLKKRSQNMTRPAKLEIPDDLRNLTREYVPHRRKRTEQNNSLDINSLSSDIKAMLIAGILDRKF